MATVGAAFMTLGAGGAAHAITFFTEVEPNNTFATDQDVSSNDGGINVAGSRVGDSSADFFRFFATAGDVITLSANVTSLNEDGEPDGDTVLRLFDSSGTVIEFNDDNTDTDVDTFNSLISNFTITSSGIYAGAVSGFPDYDFDGVEPDGLSNDFTYEFPATGLTSSATPVPFEFSPGMGLLALGAWGAMSQLKRQVQKRKVAKSAFSIH